MTRRIGVLHAKGDTFAHDVLAALDAEPDIEARPAEVSTTPEGYVSPYDLLIDRASAEVPCYRSHLRAAVLAGAVVVNDPFRVAASDKFFGLSLAARMGLAVPPVALLPQNRYSADAEASGALAHLPFPLDWGKVTHYVGYPAVLAPVGYGASLPCAEVSSLEQLWRAFDASGEAVTLLRAAVEGPRHRLVCIGADSVFAAGETPLTPALTLEAEHAARRLSLALGFQLNCVEVTVRAGRLLVTDPGEPFASLDAAVLGPLYEPVVEAAAHHFARLARSGGTPSSDHAWGRALTG